MPGAGGGSFGIWKGCARQDETPSLAGRPTYPYIITQRGSVEASRQASDSHCQTDIVGLGNCAQQLPSHLSSYHFGQEIIMKKTSPLPLPESISTIGPANAHRKESSPSIPQLIQRSTAGTYIYVLCGRPRLVSHHQHVPNDGAGRGVRPIFRETVVKREKEYEKKI